VDIYLIGD